MTVRLVWKGTTLTLTEIVSYVPKDVPPVMILPIVRSVSGSMFLKPTHCVSCVRITSPDVRCVATTPPSNALTVSQATILLEHHVHSALWPCPAAPSAQTQQHAKLAPQATTSTPTSASSAHLPDQTANSVTTTQWHPQWTVSIAMTVSSSMLELYSARPVPIPRVWVAPMPRPVPGVRPGFIWVQGIVSSAVTCFRHVGCAMPRPVDSAAVGSTSIPVAGVKPVVFQGVKYVHNLTPPRNVLHVTVNIIWQHHRHARPVTLLCQTACNARTVTPANSASQGIS